MRLLLDEMYSGAIVEGLRRRGIDALGVQQHAELRGIPDDQVFVVAQMETRCVVTENIADFVAVEAAWRSQHSQPHFGVILVAPRAFSRHRRGAVGQITNALASQVASGLPRRGEVAWLE